MPRILAALWQSPALLMDMALRNDQSALMFSAPLKRTWADLEGKLLNTAVSALRPRYKYMIADLPHDSEDTPLDILDKADTMVLSFAPARFVSAINRGIPLVHGYPEDPVPSLIEDFSFRLSKEAHQGIPPAAPGAAWHCVNDRLQLFSSKQRKKTSFLSFN